jgi:hypothetical protein
MAVAMATRAWLIAVFTILCSFKTIIKLAHLIDGVWIGVGSPSLAFRVSCPSTDRVLLGYGLCRWITAFLSKILHPSSEWKLLLCRCGYVVYEGDMENLTQIHRIGKENPKNKKPADMNMRKRPLFDHPRHNFFVAGGT